jgi:hypothetical protein
MGRNIKYHKGEIQTVLDAKVMYMIEDEWRREIDVCTNGISFTLKVTEFFIQSSEADWLIRVCDSRCTEAFRT